MAESEAGRREGVVLDWAVAGGAMGGEGLEVRAWAAVVARARATGGRARVVEEAEAMGRAVEATGRVAVGRARAEEEAEAMGRAMEATARAAEATGRAVGGRGRAEAAVVDWECCNLGAETRSMPWNSCLPRQSTSVRPGWQALECTSRHVCRYEGEATQRREQLRALPNMQRSLQQHPLVASTNKTRLVAGEPHRVRWKNAIALLKVSTTATTRGAPPPSDCTAAEP